MDNHQIWEPAALILGFQAASYAWRMAEESRVSRARDITWLPVADALNLLSIASSLVGVFVAPLIGYYFLMRGPTWLGLSLLLFLGHLVALAGHYELFDVKNPRSMRYSPRQERIAVGCTIIAVGFYLYFALVP